MSERLADESHASLRGGVKKPRSSDPGHPAGARQLQQYGRVGRRRGRERGWEGDGARGEVSEGLFLSRESCLGLNGGKDELC